eukprot:6734154-Lingulodinium_polyedra.AAC.1
MRLHQLQDPLHPIGVLVTRLEDAGAAGVEGLGLGTAQHVGFADSVDEGAATLHLLHHEPPLGDPEHVSFVLHTVHHAHAALGHLLQDVLVPFRQRLLQVGEVLELRAEVEVLVPRGENEAACVD